MGIFLVLALALPLPALAQQLDVSGLWRSDFGVMKLVQEGARVTGSYSCCQGTLTGSLEGRKLKLDWEDPVHGEGKVIFDVDASVQRMFGRWWYRGNEEAQGRWNADRAATAEVPPHQGEPTFWRVTGRSGDAILAGSATLYFDGEKFAGRIEGVYSITLVGQKRMRLEVLNEIEGTARGSEIVLYWNNPIDGASGEMKLQVVGDELRGGWTTTSGKDRGEIHMKRVIAAPESSPGAEELAEKRFRQLDAERLFEEAETLRSAAEYQEAIAKYHETISKLKGIDYPERLSYAYYGLGEAYRAKGEHEEAERWYRKVLEMGESAEETIRLLAEMALL